MIESYRVGAVLELRDEASPAIRALFENAARLEKMFGDVQKAISGINRVALGDFTAKLGGISEKLTGIKTSAEGLGAAVIRSLQNADSAFTESGRAITGYAAKFDTIPEASRVAIEGVTGNLGRADAALGASTEAAARLAAALREAGSASRDIPRLPGRGGGGYGGGDGGGHTRPGQSGRGRDHSRIQTVHGDRPNLSGPHGAFIDAGMLGMIGGHEVAEAVERSLHRGMEMAHVQQQMGQAGIAQPDIDRATSSAWQQARDNGLDVAKVLADIKELVLPFGSVAHAIEFIQPLEKMRVVLNAVSEGRGNESSEAVYKMARAGELKGLNNAEEYLKYFDGMTKAISASGGKVTPNSFAQVTQYGKLASQGWSEDFYTKSLPTLMQTMNASTAGQSLMSLFNTLESGAVSKRSFGQMSDLGMIGDESKVEYEGGKYKGLRPGAIVGSDLLAQNPLEWSRQFLTPLLEKKFGDLSDDKNKLSAIENLGGLFGNRNSAAAVAELALRVKSFDRDKGLIDQAHGINGADALLKNDPTTAINNFSAAWTNLLTALGGPAVKPATDMLNGMSVTLNKIGEAAQAHPEIAKSIEGALGGLAVGLGALAAVGLAMFAPGGLAVVALTSLASALAGIAAVNWDKIREGGSSLTPAIDAINEWNTEVRDKIVGSISHLGAIIGDAFTSMIDGVIAKLRSIPGVGRLFGTAPDALHPDGTREGTDRSYHKLSPDETMKYMQGLFPGLSPIVDKTTQGMDQLGGKTGIVNISFDNLDRRAVALNDNFTGLGSGSGAVVGALNILTATAIGAARALAQVAMSGGGGVGGGGSGFINTSYGDGSLGGGFSGSAAALAGAGGVGGKTGGVNPVLLAMVHRASELSGAPLSVYSGYRSPEHNAAVGGAGHSLHMSGYASDLTSPGHSKQDGAFWARINRAMAQAAGEMHQPYRWGGNFPGRYARDNDHFDLTSRGPSAAAIEALRHHSAPIAGAPPSRTVAPGKPAAAGGMSAMNAPQHIHVYVGDEKVAHHVAGRMVAAMEHPNAVGGPDTYGSWQGPATPLNDAA